MSASTLATREAYGVARLLATAASRRLGTYPRLRLEGTGFGFLIPIYFVVTGMSFDLDSLLTARGLGLAALFLGLLVVVRGVSPLLCLRELDSHRTLGLALFGATGRPLIVAIIGIGTTCGAVSAQVGASLVGARLISLLAFPLVALALVGRRETAGQVSPRDEKC